MQWVTHEVWVPGRRTVAFVDWPRGMQMIDVDRGVMRRLTYFPAWHAAPDDAGTRFVCDTNFPDRGLHTFDVDDDPADDAEPLCASEATSEGKHWGGPFPYNDGPVAVEARSTPIRIRASRRTARACCSPPTRPAMRSSMK